MLSALTPYILGVLIQVGAILGEKLVPVPTGVTSPAAVTDAKRTFGKNLDTAQLLPSFLTLLVGTLLVAPDLGRSVTAIFVVLAVIAVVLLLRTMSSVEVDEYAAITERLHGVSLLNAVMLVANVVFGAVVLMTS